MLQITVRTREGEIIRMSEFFASFVTGSFGIPVETRGIRWIVFLVAPPPPSSRVMEMTQNISYAQLFSASYELQQFYELQQGS